MRSGRVAWAGETGSATWEPVMNSSAIKGPFWPASMPSAPTSFGFAAVLTLSASGGGALAPLHRICLDRLELSPLQFAVFCSVYVTGLLAASLAVATVSDIAGRRPAFGAALFLSTVVLVELITSDKPMQLLIAHLLRWFAPLAARTDVGAENDGAADGEELNLQGAVSTPALLSGTTERPAGRTSRLWLLPPMAETTRGPERGKHWARSAMTDAGHECAEARRRDPRTRPSRDERRLPSSGSGRVRCADLNRMPLQGSGWPA